MSFAEAPGELQWAIVKYWPEEEWENAAEIARRESGWNAFAKNDTTSALHPCGTVIEVRGTIRIAAERSVGYFQINVCNLPSDWEWERLYNADHNAGTAHMLWEQAGGWSPWHFSAQSLGLL